MAEWTEEITHKNQEPNTHFRIKLGSYELYILCGHIYYPGQWIMGIENKQYNLKMPKGTDVNKVKTAALGLAISLLEKQVRLANGAIFAAMEVMNEAASAAKVGE